MRSSLLRRSILGGLLATVASLAAATRAEAAPITYTFSGVGRYQVNNDAAQSGAFTFTFVGDTANILPSGTQFFQLNLAGSFTDGSYSAALTATNIVTVNNDPSFPRVGFFNGTVDNGFTLQNGTLTSYNLATAFGPINASGGSLLPTLNSAGHGFATTGGGLIQILAVTSGTFSAAQTAVPEPSTIALAATAVCGLIPVVRSKRRKA